MSGARVRYFPGARRDLEEALGWYVERSHRAAKALVHEVDHAIGLISSSPGIWPRFEAGTRRYILRNFPYDIIYRETESGIEVVAVAHHKRRPRYWHQRTRR